MAYTYKHKRTGKVIESLKPMTGSAKNDYVLVSYIKNGKIKSAVVIKK